MCKLLLEHGAGREAALVDTDTGTEAIYILHFAAADPTTDYRQWQCLFDKFRQYIDEPCPRIDWPTPLHVALGEGCTQGMQIAVEFGANKEARNGFSQTPLSSVALDITDEHPSMFEERTVCIRKFVELGASLESEVDSLRLLLVAVHSYIMSPVNYPLTRQLIYVLLEQRADIHGTDGWQNTNMVNEIVNGILEPCLEPSYHTESLELYKELLSRLVDTGLNFTKLSPGLSSPLFRILIDVNSHHASLIHLLCANGATIHEHEVDRAFLLWCYTTQMWETNEYDAWWQHQGQEDEIFRKWCEHPYNVWWWQHVKHISPYVATQAYVAAFDYKDRHLYDILTHLPLPAPLDGLLIEAAFEVEQLWSWRLFVHREYEDDFLATWSFYRYERENMIHLTVRMYVAESCYSAADAVLDVLHLRDKGVNMTSTNSHGQTPLDLLLRLGSCKDDYLELVAILEGKMGEQEVLETTTLELRKMTLY